VGGVFSPLDEALGLLSGSLSPQLWEGLVRLGSRLSFAQAVDELAFFWKVDVSDETARRVTEAAGAAYEAVQAAECASIRTDLPEPPQGPAVQQLSLDGVLVHATDGEWVEVKTAAIGTVGTRIGRDGEPEAHTSELSYFCRAAEVERFTPALLVEIERRGTQTAGVVVSVNDGAAWIQGVVDHYRRDAVRILDFAHATEHLAQAAAAVYGRDTPALHAWMDQQAEALKHKGPATVLAALRALPVAEADNPAAAGELRAETLAYFLARLDQLQYPAFVAAGYPIGSGAVESAGKLVIQARLKGSGMRWQRTNLNPMVALRTIVCSGRWTEAWPRIRQHLREQEAHRRHTRWQQRQPAPAPAPTPPAPDLALLRSAAKKLRSRPAHPPRVEEGRPTADHPWRRPLRRLPRAS